MRVIRLLPILSCVICFLRHANGARILGMFPMQGKSHWLMFQEVMKSLADAGHQVDVVSHFPQKKPYPNYNDLISLAGTMPVVINNMTYDIMQSFDGTSWKVLAQLSGTDVCNLLEFPELQKLIKNPPKDPPYDLVVAEYFFASCYFAFGRHLKVPVVALSSSSVLPHSNAPLGNPLNTAIVSEIRDRPVSPMNFWQRLTNTIAVFLMNEQANYYIKRQNEIVRKHFGPDMPDIEQLERELALLLVNSHPIFHGVRPFTPAVVEVSGLHVHDDKTPIPTELQKWLDDSKNGFIYFSMGSMVKVESFPKAALAEIFSAFAKVAPIRILMKAGNPEELPPGLPDNVKTVTWAPQVQVLKHKNIRGFLTHGGLMGLQEAVTFAVPLIGMPLFGDQMGNIDRLVAQEIAVSLNYKNLKSDEIVAAINAVAHDPKFKKNMNAVSKQFLDRPRDARSLTVFWIEYILKHGEDALRSPAVNLAWWELALLDVYGSIIAVVLVVLYVVKLLLSAIIGRILYTNKTLLSSKKRN